jgi:hypothetical protein
MTQPTKADLAAAVAKLTEENAQLRDLLAAVRDTAQIPAAPIDQLDDEKTLREQRSSQIRNWLKGEDFSSPDQVQFLTRLFRGKAEPVTYRPVCDERIPPADGVAVGDWCQLDPGHDGDHSPEPEQQAVCPSIRDGMKCTRTVTADGHPGLHMDSDGNTWTRGDDSADLVTVPDGQSPRPATHPDHGSPCTAPMNPHPMPHRDEDGEEWAADPFAQDIDRVNAASRP